MRQHKPQKQEIPRKQSKCLNCGFDFGATQENYCPECGQKNTLRKAKVSTLLSEFFADFFLFDSKIFKSWVFLLFRPGFLTKAYNEGKRVRYISPIRLFLFSGVIFFFILSFILREAQWSEGIHLDLKEGNSNPKLGFTLGDKKYDLLNIERNDTLTEFPDTINTGLSIVEMSKTMTEDEIIDSLGIDNKVQEVTTRQTIKLLKNRGENYVKSIFNNTSLAILCMQPFVAFLLGLIYFRRKDFFVDHLIFSLHQHAFLYTFLSIVAIFLSKQVQLLEQILQFLLMIYAVYLFFSLKSVYQQGIGKTLLKTGILSFLYMFLISLFVFLLMGISFYLF